MHETSQASGAFDFNRQYGIGDLMRDGSVPWADKPVITVVMYPIHIVVMVGTIALAMIPFIA